MFGLYDKRFDVPLLLGTSRYPSLDVLIECIDKWGVKVVTTSLRKQSALNSKKNLFWETLQSLNVDVLPNTAGCKTVKEAIMIAQMAREVFATDWIKLEVIENDDTLKPFEAGTTEAAEMLVKEGFKVFPYITSNASVCEQLAKIGCQVIMPWGSYIGSGQGLVYKKELIEVRKALPDHTLIVDAGIGKPSDACLAMELGYDGVLINTAIARAQDPIIMTGAFIDALFAGKKAREAGVIPEQSFATPSTTPLGMPIWHQE